MLVKKKKGASQPKSALITFMDKKVWKALPEDLIDRVLAWLPLRSLFRVRGVCKKWNVMIHSRIFLDICAQVSNWETYFLLFPSLGEEIVYSGLSSTCNMWQRMPSLAFLPPHVKYIDGGAGGLLFLSVGSCFESLSLYVCNPMTKQWKQLPPIAHKRTPIVRHMVIDKQTRRYKIVLAGNIDLVPPESLGNNCTEVYDSASHKWLTTGKLPLNVDLNWSSAYSDGHLFCVANEVDSSKLGIITYNVQQGVWRDRLYTFPDDISLAQVVESCGKIYVVAELYKTDHLRSIHILKFTLETGLWTKISKLPRNLLREFRKMCEEESFNSVVLGNRILLTSYKGMQVLVFDISSKSWSWLISCPHYIGFDHRAVGFAFQPCLHICA